MSYILDALKKSDQQRQRGAAPTLHSVPAPIVAAEERRPWRYVVIALGLIGIGTLLGWLRPWQQDQRPAAKADIAAIEQNAQVSNQTTAAAHTAPAPPQPTTSAMPTPPKTPRTPSLPPPAPAMAKPKIAPTIAPPLANEQTNAVTPTDTSTDPGRVIAIEELPLGIRQELPQLSVSLHAYAHKPEDRLVSINNKLLHEGGSPAPGVRLEKITPDGMILSFKGYRFSRGVQ